LSHLLCVGEIISLPWFSKELKNDLSKNNWLRDVILILLIRKSIFDGWGFSFSIVLVPRYKLSLCHTLIKPHLLDFSGIGVFAYGLLNRMFKRFALRMLKTKKMPKDFWPEAVDCAIYLSNRCPTKGLNVITP
jgi:hypothetical protein